MGGDNSAILAAGLPNIVGSIYGGAGDTFNTPNGAFELKSASSAWNFSSASSSSSERLLEFDASKSNEIYGKSDKVLPESFALIAQIKY